MITVLVTVGAVSSAVLAVAALLKLLGVGKGWKMFGLFLADWFGEEARPGHDAVPSFPERMKSLEDSGAALFERVRQADHQLRNDLQRDLGKIQLTLTKRETQSVALMTKLDAMDSRITDHRDRNRQQVIVLQEAVDLILHRLDSIESRAEQRRAEDADTRPSGSPSGYDQ